MTTSDDSRVDRHRPERSRTLLWIFGVLVAVALVVGAVVGALRGPTALDPATPEGVVQAYLEAVLDRDYAEAVGYLSEQTADRCPASAFRRSWVPEDLAADLEDVQVSGDQAEVQVRLRTAVDPLPFAGGAFTSTEAFTLINGNGDGDWRLTGDPWPLYSCEESA